MKRFLLAVAIFLVVVFALVKWRGAENARAHKPETVQAVPVTTAVAQIADVPITVDGIGTVQALNTVNIHPMVDGPLIDIRFREGQDVRAGDVLARIDPRLYQATLDQYVAKKAQDEASLANARVDLTRYQKLARSAYSTQQQADTQAATVAQDQALVRQDQAQIDNARTNLSYTTIVAPVDGRTGIRQVDLGNIVHGTDTTPLTVVTTLRPISVVFTLPQQDLAQVSAAMQAGAPQVVALPQNAQGEILDRGTVVVLDNQVDPNTGTIKLKAQFPNAALRLWPGAFVNVRLALRMEHGVITVPAAAAQRGPLGAYVYVVDAKNVATRRPVVVDHQDENIAVIASGLRAGERVITDGMSRVSDGAHVK